MHILCWNIQLNSAKKITDEVAELIASEVQHIKNKSFALFILESKNDADVVGHRIKDAIGNAEVKTCDAGGNPHRREHVICIHSNDVSVSRMEAFTKWQSEFKKRCDEEKNVLSQTRAEYGANARNLHFLRSEPAELKFSNVCAVDLRNPVLWVLKTPMGELKVVVVHSPGPGAKIEHMSKPEAELYFAAIMSVLRNEDIHVVIGDFNLYKIKIAPQGFIEQNAGLAPTTYGSGRLDRVFVKDISKCYAYLFGSTVKPSYTDHRGIGLRVVNPAIWASSLVDMRCSVCQVTHGAQISIIRRWHKCKNCGELYCGNCGSNLERLVGLWALMPNRQCKCGGQTDLLK